jgi:GTPase SAR1 family protein
VQGVILVYDITDKASLDKVDYWHEEAKRYLPDAEFILIGNKTDKFMERKLSTLDGQVSSPAVRSLQASSVQSSKVICKFCLQAIAHRLGMPFFETSAMESYNVEAAFRTICSNIFINDNLRGPLPLPADSAFQLHLKSSCSWDSDSAATGPHSVDDEESTWWNRWGRTWRACIPF